MRASVSELPARKPPGIARHTPRPVQAPRLTPGLSAREQEDTGAASEQVSEPGSASAALGARGPAAEQGPLRSHPPNPASALLPQAAPPPALPKPQAQPTTSPGQRVTFKSAGGARHASGPCGPWSFLGETGARDGAGWGTAASPARGVSPGQAGARLVPRLPPS